MLCVPIIDNYFSGLVLLSDWMLSCSFLLFVLVGIWSSLVFGSNLGFLFLFLCVFDFLLFFGGDVIKLWSYNIVYISWMLSVFICNRMGIGIWQTQHPLIPPPPNKKQKNGVIDRVGSCRSSLAKCRSVIHYQLSFLIFPPSSFAWVWLLPCWFR